MEKRIKLINLILICVSVIVSLIFIFFAENDSLDSQGTVVPNIVFEGEYKLGDNDWKEYEKGEFISAYSGDLYLKGKFIIVFPNGKEYGEAFQDSLISIRLDHISGEVFINDKYSYSFENENKELGYTSCCEKRIVFKYVNSSEGEMLLHFSNPHLFGNANAYNELLDFMFLYSRNTYYEKTILYGDAQRSYGLFMVIFSLVVICTGFFALALKIRNDYLLFILGLYGLSIGIFNIYNSHDVSVWNSEFMFNTNLSIISFIFSVLFFYTLAIQFFKSYKKLAKNVFAFYDLFYAITLIICLFSKGNLFDSFLIVSFMTIAFDIFILVLSILELKKKNRTFFIYLSLATIVILIVDFVLTAIGLINYGIIFKYLSIFIFIIYVYRVILLLAKEYVQMIKEKEIAMELQESRLAIMTSQINPHFLYNSLSSIAELCEFDAKEAQDATVNFASYLRGNMKALTNKTGISFEEELSHLENYLALELIRFGDSLHIEYDIQVVSFNIPPLTIQPLVENAIKHGIRRRESGGKVLIRSYEESKGYVIEIIDDGVGFDPNVPKNDGKEHIGVENTKKRLDIFCKGKMEIESKIGEGTKVKIYIPKGGD